MIRRSFLALALGAGFAVTATADAGESARTLRASFSIFWASLPIFSARFDATVGGGQYSITYAARTRGALRLFVKANTTNHVAGTIKDGTLVPRRYRDVLVWRGHRSSAVLNFLPQGVRARYEPPGEAANRRPVPKQALNGAIDPLTALLRRLLRSKDAPPCQGRLRLFDGRQLFELALKNEGMHPLPEDRLSPRRGPALRCRVGYHHIVDTQIKSSEVAKRSSTVRDSAVPITIWLQYQAGDGMWLPVRAEGGTRLGAVTAVLISFSATRGSDKP